MPGIKRNPSIHDVAEHAGVSIATVSNVINRPEKVTAATTSRVRASISALGFVRNAAARSLAVGSSSGLGMVLADLENSLFVDMAHGAQESAKEAGFRLLLGNSMCNIPLQDEYLDLFDEARVAGLLLAPMEDSALGIERMRSHGRPIVLLNYAQSGAECCTVLVDNEEVGYLAARHLIDSGRRRIAFVAGRYSLQPVQDRRAGVERAILESGGTVELLVITVAALDHDDGVAAATDLLAGSIESLPDGIVAVTDAVGNGMIERFTADGRVRVPRDVHIVGCEDNRSAQIAPLTLTTVHPPGREMGEAAMELLLEEMTMNPEEHVHRTIVLHPRLLVRASTGR